jgi:hypothetical protein
MEKLLTVLADFKDILVIIDSQKFDLVSILVPKAIKCDTLPTILVVLVLSVTIKLLIILTVFQ